MPAFTKSANDTSGKFSKAKSAIEAISRRIAALQPTEFRTHRSKAKEIIPLDSSNLSADNAELTAGKSRSLEPFVVVILQELFVFSPNGIGDHRAVTSKTK